MAKHEKDFFYSRCNITYARSVSSEWVYVTGRQGEEYGKRFVSDKGDRAITCVFCHDLLLTLMFSAWSFSKRSAHRKVKFGGKVFQTKLLSTLSHKACRLLSSPVLLRKFSNISSSHEEGDATKPTECFFHATFEVYGSRTYTTASCLVCFVIK